MFEMFKKKTLCIYLVIVFFGILTIWHQLNYENFWLDEMNSFWIADPKLSFEDSLIRQKKTDFHNPLLFNLTLKEFLNFTVYEPTNSRILPFIFGSISICFFGILSYQIKKDSSFLFTTFLASVSIYIIKYSQEVRPYSLLLMLSIINIFLFCIISNNVIKEKFYNFIILLIFIIISVLNYSTNPFALIILFSQITNLLYVSFYLNKKNNLLFFSLIPIIIFYFLLNSDYLVNQLSYSSYMLSPDIMNVIDGLYFPRFFGSKIMGYIYLITLLFLIFYKKKIILQNNNYLLLVIIFLFSYFIPLTYGLIRTPVLHDRYIIFVLIPVILLISCLANEITSNKIKNSIFFILIVSTLCNHYLEIVNRKNTKPEFVNLIKHIKDSSSEKNIIIYDKFPTSNLVFNYLNNLEPSILKNLNLIQYKDNLPKDVSSFWLLCYTPNKEFNCNISETKIWKPQIVNKKYLVEAKLFKLN